MCLLVHPLGPKGLSGLGRHIPASQSTGAPQTLCLSFQGADRQHCDCPQVQVPLLPSTGAMAPAPTSWLLLGREWQVALPNPFYLSCPLAQAHSPKPLLPGY